MKSLTKRHRQHVIDQAAAALDHARVNRVETGIDIAVQVWQQHGESGLGLFLVALADTVCHYCHGPLPDGAVVTPVVRIADTMAVIDIDTIPWEIRWAARFMAARAMKDHDTCEALGQSVPAEEWPGIVCAMLMTAALTIENLGRT